MIHIYHNPRCSKSRIGLEIVEKSGQEFKVIHYLKDVPSVQDLTVLIALLKMKPIDLVRKNEAIWKAQYKQQTLTDIAIIEAMVAHPKLIERPIVIKENTAVIGRPSENIEQLLSK